MRKVQEAQTDFIEWNTFVLGLIPMLCVLSQKTILAVTEVGLEVSAFL